MEEVQLVSTSLQSDGCWEQVPCPMGGAGLGTSAGQERGGVLVCQPGCCTKSMGLGQESKGEPKPEAHGGHPSPNPAGRIPVRALGLVNLRE